MIRIYLKILSLGKKLSRKRMQLYHTGHIPRVSAQHSWHEAAVSELEGHPQLHGEATQKNDWIV